MKSVGDAATKAIEVLKDVINELPKDTIPLAIGAAVALSGLVVVAKALAVAEKALDKAPDAAPTNTDKGRVIDA